MKTPTSATTLRKALAVFGAIALSAASREVVTEYRSATIAYLQATLPDTDCFCFSLAGVNQADPVVPGASWFRAFI